MARSTIVRHETAVGAFTLLCAGILILGVIIKGSKVGFGARNVTFTAPESGHDLKVGAVVKMQGIEIGEVENVDLEKEGVHVHLKIYPEFRDFVHADAKVSIVEPPVIGSTSVEVFPGTKAEPPVAQRAHLEYVPTEGIMTKIQSSQGDVQKVLDQVKDIAKKTNDTLDNVDKIVARVNAGEGVMGRLVRDDQLAQDFTKGVTGLVAFIDDVHRSAPDLQRTIADVRSLTDAVAEGKGSLGRLVTNDTIVVESENVLKDVRTALARLEEITKDTTATTKKVQDVLDSTKGTLDKLDGTIRNAEKVTGQLAEITAKVNTGQGSLAKLVNDDALFRETKALLKEVRESVEDLREQAPINSFIGVVFSAF
jgi:phospholipid/cholesterol/gamma-HCH transport system substrate-binding protein